MTRVRLPDGDDVLSCWNLASAIRFSVPETDPPNDGPEKSLPGRPEELPNEPLENREQWRRIDESVKHERPAEQGVSDTKAPPPKK